MQYRTIRPASSHPAEEGAPAADPLATLGPEEIRVLGSLVEKDSTTPDYYPLTLNALVAACNQKSSRDPVVSYSEDIVTAALDRLREKGLARVITSSEAGRVPRYRHLFHEGFRLSQPQGAALCTLMLRGPQTVGEIRSRANRIYDFASLAEVQETLDELMGRETRPLAARLPRQAGTKESRYAHMLGGEIPSIADDPAALVADHSPANAETADRVERLEGEVQRLRAEVDGLKQTFETFRKQFE